MILLFPATMTMTTVIVLPTLLVALLCPGSPAGRDEDHIAEPTFRSVTCEGTDPKHLQGVCTDGKQALSWCFTDRLVKTDLDGTVLKPIPVGDHQGDVCHHDGKVYVAVNFGPFNQPEGTADSWVYVYDAETLEERARHPVPEVVHGAGGIACHDGRFLVVGGLPEGVEENHAYESDEPFRFRRRHVVPSGSTLRGIQTATFADGHWWFGCYGEPRVLLKVDQDFKIVGRWEFDAALGLEGLPDGRFLVSGHTRQRGVGYTGWVQIALADDQTGLRLLEP